MKRLPLWIFLSFLVWAMVLPLTSCTFRSQPLIRYNISSGAENLDPQFAQQPNELLIVLNCFEGLFRLNADGVPVPAAAQRYTLSSDGLTYTFYLRENMLWSDETPLTAHDFVFAFERLFQSSSPAPNAQDFLCIQNARQVLSGQLSAAQLGVRALNDLTLEIKLEEPNLFFPELLATAAAMPCREDFFYQSNGRYGLSLDTLVFNGPYRVRSWNNDKYIGLQANETYHTPEQTPECTVYLYTTRPAQENAYLLLSDRGDGGPVFFQDLEQLQSSSFTITSFQNTVYLLVFNPQNASLQNKDIRLGMAYAFNRQLFQPYLEENLTLTDLMIPPIASIQGESYRSLVSVSGLAYDSAAAKSHFSAGLEQLGVSRLSKNTLICLDTGPHKMLSGFIQQQWQNDLNLYVNTEALSSSDFYARIASGNFQMAIVPITMAQSNPGAFLSQISRYLPQAAIAGDPSLETQSDQNLSDTVSDLHMLQEYCSLAQGSKTSREAARWFAQAESMLLNNGYVIPLYFESSYFALSDAFENVLFTPSGIIYFQEASARKR